MFKEYIWRHQGHENYQTKLLFLVYGEECCIPEVYSFYVRSALKDKEVDAYNL